MLDKRSYIAREESTSAEIGVHWGRCVTDLSLDGAMVEARRMSENDGKYHGVAEEDLGEGRTRHVARFIDGVIQAEE